MSSETLTQLRQLQQSLYEKAYKEAHAIVGGASRAILAYSEMFQKSLPKRALRTTQADMIDAIKAHQIILYGDFHTLRQSQRGLLRLLRTYVERQRTKKVVLALEMFKAVDQDFIDGYLAGRFPDSVFLASVNYATEWGFPWQNFKMILDFARTRRLPVIGINTDNAGRDSLLCRDRFAAQCLVKLARDYPDHKIVCLIGEYHLADGHLPKALKLEQKGQRVKIPVLRVLNNVDQYYFDLSRKETHALTEYLRLRKDFYCIMNSPPWMKWQSFSLWEEMRHIGSAASDQDSPPSQDLDLYNEDAFDVDYQFLSFVKNLSGFMALTIDASDMESFHLHFSPDGDFYEDLTRDGLLDDEEAKRVIGRAIQDGVYFLNRTNTVLLTYISINNLAEAAGQYLHALLTGFDEGAASPGEAFYRRVLKAAVGMIASKIMNPRRQCVELHHLRQIQSRYKKGDLVEDGKRQTAAAILRFNTWMDAKSATPSLKLLAPPRSIIVLDQSSDYAVSRAIGQMLGFTLYKKVIAGKVPSTRIRRLFKTPVNSESALWREISWLHALMTSR